MSRNQEQRHVYYDHDLEIEAYQLSGVVQKFPNHFHDFYVIGFIEGGERHLQCRGREYDLRAGDLVLFNPRDNHNCAPVGDALLDYRAVNVSPAVMRKAAGEITGTDDAPRFTQNVVHQSDAAAAVREVYDAIVGDAPRLQKEEAFFYLLEQLLQECAAPFESPAVPTPDAQIQSLCAYMEQHYAENISLETLLAMTHFGRSYLLRSFTRQLGVSPYRYLQTIRIDRAKKLLEQGVAPIDAAGSTGFSDQSHFTNFFKSFIGLTPKQYQRIFTDSLPSAIPGEEARA